jgi:hypothetical protein
MSQITRRAAIVLTFASALFAASPARTEPVDLLLVLAADVSRSVDSQKFQLQREGYAAALADPRVIDAISRADVVASACCSWNGRDLATRRS